MDIKHLLSRSVQTLVLERITCESTCPDSGRQKCDLCMLALLAYRSTVHDAASAHRSFSLTNIPCRFGERSIDI